MLKIIIIDDQKLFIRLMADKLQQYAYYSVEGVFSSATKCLEFLENNEVDIALIDVNMPLVNGLELLQKIKELYPNIKTIMLSNNSNINIIKQAYEIGANCYITKSSDEEEILDVIEKVTSGGTHYGKISIEELLLNPKNLDSTVNFEMLSERENEYVNYVKRGLKVKTIAEEMNISQFTVKKHGQNVFLKLGVKSIEELLSLVNNKSN